jgi:hypothetical protein
MRILKGVSSRFLPCGCLAGVYETYDAEIVTIVDARGASCTDSSHAKGNVVPEEQAFKSTSSIRRPATDPGD